MPKKVEPKLHKTMTDMKNIVAIVLALVIGYFAIGAFFWIIGHIFWITWELTKIVMIIIVALPLYVIIKKKFLR